MQKGQPIRRQNPCPSLGIGSIQSWSVCIIKLKLLVAKTRINTLASSTQGKNSKFSQQSEMERDVLIQLGILIFTLGIFYVLQSFPKRALTKLRSKVRPNNQVHRHFIQGAQFLSRARSTKNKSTAVDLAKSAVNEADKALAIEPRDPAAHILKAMAETIMGHKTSALKSLDLALSPPAVRMLSEREKGDALFKRAELQIALNRKRRVDSAIADLVEAVRLSPDNAKAFCLLGQCFEMKGLIEEGKNAFQEALKLEPNLNEAHDGLGRLGPLSGL